MATICDLTDDLRDAMVEYQVSTNMQHARTTVRSRCDSQFAQQEAIYEQNCKLIVSHGSPLRENGGF